MTVNEPGRSKLGQERKPWQWAKHAWLYSDIGYTRLQMENICHLWGLERGDLNFCVHSNQLREKKTDRQTDRDTERETERDRDRERQRQTETDRNRDRERTRTRKLYFTRIVVQV